MNPLISQSMCYIKSCLIYRQRVVWTFLLQNVICLSIKPSLMYGPSLRTAYIPWNIIARWRLASALTRRIPKYNCWLTVLETMAFINRKIVWASRVGFVCELGVMHLHEAILHMIDASLQGLTSIGWSASVIQLAHPTSLANWTVAESSFGVTAVLTWTICRT